MPKPDESPTDGAQPAQLPRVLVTFGGERLAEATITTEGSVQDGQLYLAAWLLDQYAREVRAKLNAGQQQRGLVIPLADHLPPRTPRQ